MFWIKETPKVITNKNNYILPILKKPIYWSLGANNCLLQFGMYLNYISKPDRFYALKLFSTYDISIDNNPFNKIRIARTKHIDNPKLIILYCHTLFGNYKEFSHIANELKAEPIIYFTYSRSGIHKELPNTNFNVVGSIKILKIILNHIKALYPYVPIHAIGASAGACLLIRYLGDPNISTLIKSSVLISPAYNFQKSINLIPDHIQYELLSRLKFDFKHCVSNNLINSKTLSDWMHNQYETTEYKNKDEYIRNNDPYYYLKSIKVPTLMISALDDFCFSGSVVKDYYNLPYENSNITMIITNNGGHISFIDYKSTIPWSSRIAIEHIRSKLLL